MIANQSQQLLDEADFKRGVDYSGQADYAGSSPTAPNVATDQNVGRNTKNLVDAGRKIDSKLRNQNWQNAVAEKPELGVYSQASQALRADRKTSQDQEKALGMGDRDRTQGGRVKGTVGGSSANYRDVLNNDGDSTSIYALNIDDIIRRKPRKYAGMPLQKALQELVAEYKAGGKDDLVSHMQQVKAGFIKLLRTAGERLVKQTDEGPVLTPHETGSDAEGLASTNRGMPALIDNINGLFGKLKNMKQHTPMNDPRMLKLLQQLSDACDQYGHEGKMFAGRNSDKQDATNPQWVEKLHQEISKILYQNS